MWSDVSAQLRGRTSFFQRRIHKGSGRPLASARSGIGLSALFTVSSDNQGLSIRQPPWRKSPEARNSRRSGDRREVPIKLEHIDLKPTHRVQLCWHRAALFEHSRHSCADRCASRDSFGETLTTDKPTTVVGKNSTIIMHRGPGG